MAVSPSIDNLGILKGNCYFTPTGGAEGHMGNAPEVEITASIEKLDHFSSMSGVRSKDKSVVLEQSFSLRIVLEELTAKNLRLNLMGGDIQTAGDEHSFEIGANSEITGAFRFEGTNTIGNKIDLDLPNVSFTPTGSLNLISDEWGNVEVTAEVLSTTATDGSVSFGTATVTDAA